MATRSTNLAPISIEADANTYVKLLKRAEKNGVPVREYIANRFTSFFSEHGVCNTRARGMVTTTA